MDCLTKCTGSFEPHTESRHIIDKTTGELYGDDDPCLVRLKFAELSIFGHAVVLPVQLAFRIFDIVSGGFIHRGKAAAEKSLKGRTAPIGLIVLQSLKDLAIHIAKIVLLPLAILPRTIIALSGLAFPYPARKWYGKLDRFFYVRPRDMLAKGVDCGLFFQFNAPCMTTTQFRKQENVYRYFNDYDETRARRSR